VPESNGLSVGRESGRMTRRATQVGRNARAVWDRRFVIVNQSAQALNIDAADGVTRLAAEQIVKGGLGVPMALVAGAPLLRTEDGCPVGLGAHCDLAGLDVRLTPVID